MLTSSTGEKETKNEEKCKRLTKHLLICRRFSLSFCVSLLFISLCIYYHWNHLCVAQKINSHHFHFRCSVFLFSFLLHSVWKKCWSEIFMKMNKTMNCNRKQCDCTQMKLKIFFVTVQQRHNSLSFFFFFFFFHFFLMFCFVVFLFC